MKVRWTGESLRLRITPTELEQLERGGSVSQRLGGWEVRIITAGPGMAVGWEIGVATVTLSAADIARLGEPEREGIYAHGPGARLLVEKDFPCRHPHAPEVREPETERFEPPPRFTARKDAHRS